MAGSVNSPEKLKNTVSGAADFPQFPGEDFLAHEGAQWKEMADARLATRKLLAVANSQLPPAAKAIINIDLSDLPELPVADRDQHRRHEARIKALTQNKANEERRMQIVLESWTELYTLLKTCTESSAPVLSRELMQLCDLAITRKIPGGYFDGPRAWRIILHKLKGCGRERSEADKDYYRSAERLQRASPLANGCSASEFSKRALAFLIHIKPYLAQTYDDDDTTEYIIGLMPKALREGGRRIRDKLIFEGRQHDFMYVILMCRALVQEEQTTAQPQPALQMTTQDLGSHDLDALQRTTGMALALVGAPMAPPTDAAFVGASGGGGQKWCPGCPHAKRDGTPLACFNAPSYAGPVPPSVWVDKERVRAIERAKEVNAQKFGVTNVPLVKPPQADMDKFLKSRKERKERKDRGCDFTVKNEILFFLFFTVK